MGLQFVIFFVLSLIATTHGDCISISATYTLCLAQSAIPGSKPACQCWDDFKTNAISNGCTTEQFSAFCTVQAAGCPGTSITDCFYTIPATNCVQALAQKGLCLVAAAADPTKTCSCFKTFQSTAVSLNCPGSQWMGECSAMNALCGTGTCNFDCNLLNSLMPTCTDTFNSCVDKCACYAAFPTCILNSVDFCDLAKLAELKVCLESQLACASFAYQCNSTEISIGVSEVVALYTKYRTELITRWNKALEIAGSIVEDVTQISTSLKVTFTVTVSWNDTLTTITKVIDQLKIEFSQTLGIQLSRLVAYQKTPPAAKKRAQRDEIIIEATSESSDTSMVTVFIAPIIILNGLLLWFFNH